MKYLLCLFLVGCGASMSPAMVRAQARAGVDIAKDVWVMTANACVDAAAESGNDELRLKCRALMVPAHDLIVAAAEAVDGQWSPSAACALGRATALMGQAVVLVADPAAKKASDDAIMVANSLLSGEICK